MTFKPVGVDENSNFPTRVVNKLKTLFPALDGSGKVADSALPNRLQDTTLNATYVPKWKATTAYNAGDAVLSPAGDTVTAKANFTSGASFNAANWNISAVYQPRHFPTSGDLFTPPTLIGAGIGIVGLGAGGVQYLVQNPNTLRRSNNLGVNLYNMTVPTNVTDAYVSCAQVYEWNGYIYAIFRDSTDSLCKLYRAPLGGNIWDAVTWTLVLTLTAGALGYGFTITGTSTSLIVGEYGDPLVGGVKAAHVWRSTDGTTWGIVKTYDSAFRHVHCVAADPYNDGTVWLSGGDNVGNCFAISTDHGATWTELIVGAQWQATQLSFTKDYVYAAPDAVSMTSLFVIDKVTRTPKVGAMGTHRALAIREMGAYRTGSSTSASTTFTDPAGPFVAADKGRKIYGPGIPDGTTISTVGSATSVTLSAAATATASPTYYAIDRIERPMGTCFQGAVDPATGIYYGSANAELGSSATFGRKILFFVPYPGGPIVHFADLISGGASVQVGQGKVWVGQSYMSRIPL